MTTDRDRDRRIREWLDLMPGTVPDRAVADLLEAVEATTQERRASALASVIRRVSEGPVAIAAAAVVVVLVGAITLSVYPRGIGMPAVSPTPATTATSIPAPMPVPAELAGAWVADPAGDLAFEGAAAGRLALAIEANGTAAFVTLADDPAIHLAAYTEAIDAERLRFATRPGDPVVVDGRTLRPCVADEVGTYRYVRSTDGLLLTLIAEADPCPSRSAVLARTWVRSLGAANSGGLGVVDRIDPPFTVELPQGSYTVELHPGAITVVQALPEFQFLAFEDPQGFLDPCDPGAGRYEIAPGADAIVEYFQQLEGFTVDSTDELLVDGRRAIRLVLHADLDGGCPDAGRWLAQWQPKRETGDQHWRLLPGDTDSLVIVELPGRTLMFEVLPAPHALESDVIDSIRFLEGLPTGP
jgi:hypothetical protein